MRLALALFAFVSLNLLAAPGSSAKDNLHVAATIAPVHSLVARVMAGVGSPDLIVRPGASPHGYSMKPSEAAALERARVVFWVGEGLERWFVKPLKALASDAIVVELGEVDGVTHLPNRETGFWGADADRHGHKDDDHDDEGHKDHGDEDHKDHAEEGHKDHAEEGHKDHAEEGHKDHAEEGHDEHGEDAHGHDHGKFDPHLWLDPKNAAVWLDAIADALAKADPANADAYRANAAAAKTELAALEKELHEKLRPVAAKPFVVFHDAYHYFESRFELTAVGSVSLGDASKPSPARVAKLRAAIKKGGAVCIFTEPQFPPKLAKILIEGTDTRIAELDPIGAKLEPGPTLYPTLLRRLAGSLTECLGAK